MLSNAAPQGDGPRSLGDGPEAPNPLTLGLHAFVPRSRANGPGWRAVVWLQGCSLGCPGCFNPATHPFAGGELAAVNDVFSRIAAVAGVEGITLSGGEPLQQLVPVTELVRLVRARTNLSVLLFTGFGWEEVQAMPGAARLLVDLDVVIAGRYRQAERVASGLRGSANKTVHFQSARYHPLDLDPTPHAEVVILPDGDSWVSGIAPPATK